MNRPIKISYKNGESHIQLGGTDISEFVIAANLILTPDNLPILSLQVTSLDMQIDLEDSQITIQQQEPK